MQNRDKNSFISSIPKFACKQHLGPTLKGINSDGVIKISCMSQLNIKTYVVTPSYLHTIYNKCFLNRAHGHYSNQKEKKSSTEFLYYMIVPRPTGLGFSNTWNTSTDLLSASSAIPLFYLLMVFTKHCDQEASQPTDHLPVRSISTAPLGENSTHDDLRCWISGPVVTAIRLMHIISFITASRYGHSLSKEIFCSSPFPLNSSSSSSRDDKTCHPCSTKTTPICSLAGIALTAWTIGIQMMLLLTCCRILQLGLILVQVAIWWYIFHLFLSLKGNLPSPNILLIAWLL